MTGVVRYVVHMSHHEGSQNERGNIMSTTGNADVIMAHDGTLTITHDACGLTWSVKPVHGNGLTFAYTSDAHFCFHCENNDMPALLDY